jgi:hypothetical protein
VQVLRRRYRHCGRRHLACGRQIAADRSRRSNRCGVARLWRFVFLLAGAQQRLFQVAIALPVRFDGLLDGPAVHGEGALVPLVVRGHQRSNFCLDFRQPLAENFALALLLEQVAAAVGVAAGIVGRVLQLLLAVPHLLAFMIQVENRLVVLVEALQVLQLHLVNGQQVLGEHGRLEGGEALLLLIGFQALGPPHLDLLANALDECLDILALQALAPLQLLQQPVVGGLGHLHALFELLLHTLVHLQVAPQCVQLGAHLVDLLFHVFVLFGEGFVNVAQLTNVGHFGRHISVVDQVVLRLAEVRDFQILQNLFGFATQLRDFVATTILLVFQLGQVLAELVEILFGGQWIGLQLLRVLAQL